MAFILYFIDNILVIRRCTSHALFEARRIDFERYITLTNAWRVSAEKHCYPKDNPSKDK